MRSIRGAGNKSTEVVLRMGFVRAGLTGWRVRPRGMEGNPDFVFPAQRVAVFTDGCFWHACPQCAHAKVLTNPEYWERKALLIRRKDRKNSHKLRKADWTVVRVWEHQLSSDLEKVVKRIGELVGTHAKSAPELRRAKARTEPKHLAPCSD